MDREQERQSASLCSALARSKEKENYIPPGLGHSQLLSSSHSSTDLSTSLVKDLKHSQSYLSKGFCRQSSWNLVPEPILSTPQLG